MLSNNHHFSLSRRTPETDAERAVVEGSTAAGQRRKRGALAPAIPRPAAAWPERGACQRLSLFGCGVTTRVPSHPKSRPGRLARWQAAKRAAAQRVSPRGCTADATTARPALRRPAAQPKLARASLPSTAADDGVEKSGGKWTARGDSQRAVDRAAGHPTGFRGRRSFKAPLPLQPNSRHSRGQPTWFPRRRVPLVYLRYPENAFLTRRHRFGKAYIHQLAGSFFKLETVKEQEGAQLARGLIPGARRSSRPAQ